MNFDIFNGDADGICALLQLRLAQPKNAELITGIKRDIKLLSNVTVSEGDEVTVLDVSMEKNQQDLSRILSRGAKVLYMDHHRAGDIPQHENLTALIDTDPTVCTSLLINQYLDGAYAKWAAVGAFGDNMQASADKLCAELDVKQAEQMHLQNLGIAINYNGYGAAVEDLHYHPAKLYEMLLDYADPGECIRDHSSIYQDLYQAYESDMAKTSELEPEEETDTTAVYILPDAAWARRVSGVLGNSLANAHPARAHSIISVSPKDGYVVSVRAPKGNLHGAGELCAKFPTGGGREGAAGINQLPEDMLTIFIRDFQNTYR